jgi:hypothetical protein
VGLLDSRGWIYGSRMDLVVRFEVLRMLKKVARVQACLRTRVWETHPKAKTLPDDRVFLGSAGKDQIPTFVDDDYMPLTATLWLAQPIQCEVFSTADSSRSLGFRLCGCNRSPSNILKPEC